MMRIAIFSDVHGNRVALDAVLNDVEECGEVDEYWVVGDLAALGPQPIAVLERLGEIGAVTTRGNTDRYVVTGDRPPPALEAVRNDPGLVQRFADVSANFAWTQGALDGAGLTDRLRALPLEHRVTLPDGTRVLAVHASPGADHGEGIHAGQSDEQIAAILADGEADLMFVGHTHSHLDRSVDGRRAVNLGSVSLPKPGDLRACWSLLEATPSGYTIDHRRVAYDLQAVIDALERVRHPSREWLSTFFRGDGAFART